MISEIPLQAEHMGAHQVQRTHSSVMTIVKNIIFNQNMYNKHTVQGIAIYQVHLVIILTFAWLELTPSPAAYINPSP